MNSPSEHEQQHGQRDLHADQRAAKARQRAPTAGLPAAAFHRHAGTVSLARSAGKRPKNSTVATSSAPANPSASTLSSGVKRFVIVRGRGRDHAQRHRRDGQREQCAEHAEDGCFDQ